MTTGRPRSWQRLRAATAHAIATAVTPPTCPRCHQPIRPGQPWDLGHTHDHALGGTNHPSNTRPEHAHCNRSAGATLGNHLRNQPPTPLPAIAP